MFLFKTKKTANPQNQKLPQTFGSSSVTKENLKKNMIGSSLASQPIRLNPFSFDQSALTERELCKHARLPGDVEG